MARRVDLPRQCLFLAEPLQIDPAAGIASWEETEREGGRGGRALLAGDPRLRPLAAIEAAPAGPGWLIGGPGWLIGEPGWLIGEPGWLIGGAAPRRSRIVRAIHRLGPPGYTTEVEFLERGLDLEAWGAPSLVVPGRGIAYKKRDRASFLL